MAGIWGDLTDQISIHALREEGDARQGVQPRGCGISIHALREEGDPMPSCKSSLSSYFYPRPPRGGRPASTNDHLDAAYISIHALREEGDPASSPPSTPSRNFYPRPPRGGRHLLDLLSRMTNEFLSTPSARRATFSRCRCCRSTSFLSTPSARRATAKTETKSLFSYKLYNILHEFRRALIYNGSKNYPNHAKRLKNPVRRCRENAENSPFALGRKTQNNSRPSCSKGG